MRRLLLTFALAFALWATPHPARAEPITAAVTAISGWFTTTFGKALGSFLLNLGGSLILSAVARALQPKPKQPQLKRELSVPTSRPPHRFVYGRDRVYASPAPWRVKERILYGCLILNSRPSLGNATIIVDKRPTQVTSGDMLDFSGGGALIAAAASEQSFGTGHRVWLGLGDQTGPPDQILSEAPEFFEATDGWQGRTVLWVRLDAGGTENRQRRWPRVPPEIEVEADWSFVWDPRVGAQDPDDPTTWGWSDNQALCLLDALRFNPIRRYRLDMIDLDSLIEAANIADEAVPLFHAGGTEPRYRVGGLIAWQGGEIIDQLSPLVEAGAGQLVRIGSKIGYAPGAYRAPIYTMTDILEDGGIDYQVLTPGRELPSAVKVAYINQQRDWQEAELPILPVPGTDSPVGDDGVSELNLRLVTSPTQAMRVQKITALRHGAQKRLSVTLPPDAIELVGGANLLADMPAGFTRLNGVWQVDSINPGLWASDLDGGVAMRLPVALRETSPDHYEWNPEEDEFDLVVEDFDPIGSEPVLDDSLLAPVDGDAAGGAGEILVTYTAPNDAGFRAIEFWAADVDDSDEAERIAGPFYGSANAVFDVTETGLDPDQTRYYWARSIGQDGDFSEFSAGVSATTEL